MAKKSKRYQEAAKLIEKGKAYSIEEAVALVKETSKVKFDAAVDVAFRLGVDPRQADQQLRGALVLPNGTGKTKKVLVVTEGPKAQEAKDAGADVVGGKEILEDIKKGWLDFEVMIATPDIDVYKRQGTSSSYPHDSHFILIITSSSINCISSSSVHPCCCWSGSTFEIL